MNANAISRLQSLVEAAGIVSLVDIAQLSLAEFRMKVRHVLTWYETRMLHRAAKKEQRENLLYKARLFSRNNPLLQRAIRLAIKAPKIDLHSYESLFGRRSTEFVKPGSVASMFSPAAYLTELYREARALRAVDSPYHIDVRRPDLQRLTLNQQNLDEELTVLALSNELLMEGVKQHAALNDDAAVLELLSTWRQNGMTPYHEAFERVRQAILARAGSNWLVGTAPEVMGLMSSASLLGMSSGFSPELYALLSEAITDQNAVELYTRNFGAMSPQSLMSMQSLSDYYGVSYAPLEYFVGVFSSDENYPNNHYVYADVDGDGNILLRDIVRTYPSNALYFNYVRLLPVGGEDYELVFNFAQVSESSPLSIELNDVVIFVDEEFGAQVGVDYRVSVTIPDTQLTQAQLFEFVFSDVTASAQFVFSEQAPERFLLELNKWVRLQQVTGLESIEIEAALCNPYPVGQVNTYTTNDQLSCSVCNLSDGGWVVTWQSTEQDGSQGGIYQQRFSAWGETVGQETRVHTIPNEDQSAPNIAALVDGGWVVCWHSRQSTHLIYQQRYDVNGAPIGEEVQVSPTGVSGAHPGISALPDGGWVVAWRSQSNDGNYDIYQLRFDDNGVSIGSPALVNTTTADSQSLSQSAHCVTTLLDGGWVVAWNSNLQDGSGEGAYFQRYDMAGTPVGTETRANTTTASDQSAVSLAALTDGGWVVVWMSYAQDGAGASVQLQRYDSAGVVLGTETQVNTTTAGEQCDASISALSDGGWVVTWASSGQDSSQYGVYQQRYAADGSPVGGELRVNSFTTGDQRYPTITTLADGGWVVSYSSYGQDGSGWGIYQQRYNAGGEVASEAGWEITPSALRRITDMQLYMQRYGIDHEKALVLCNAAISEQEFGNELSQFERLFNTPPLNGYQFTPDGAQLDLNPNGGSDDPRKAVLKRAFHVDDVTLYRLLLIADYEDADGLIPNDIEHQSDLYLASLLAEVHAVSVDELAVLLAALDETTTKLSGISDAELRRLMGRLHSTTAWLQARKWSAYDLFVMTTTTYPTTLTPEIQNFLDSLNSALNGSTLSGEALITAMAPHVAASLRLESNEVAAILLRWIDQLRPNGMGVDDFWAAVKDDVPPTAQAIQFCNALAQLALIHKSIRLDANSLGLLVTQPQKLVSLPEGVTVAGHDAATLMQLAAYTDWLAKLGVDASTVLSALIEDALTPVDVAKAMGRDEELLMDACAQAYAHSQIDAAEQLYSWPEIDITLQWVTLADLLGIAPQGVSDWLELDYLEQTPPVTIAYAAWDAVANTLTAGLDSSQSTTLENRLDESLSAALAGYYLGEVAVPALELRSRDDLYLHLLIDNQVSAEVSTTRIAEAMASVQLYVNRALDGVEPDVDPTVVSRQFFIDWSTYNKRYSTWAGVSQLVYYPENYIDPTLRIGQTEMMDTLLQSINQSHLTSDTVEDAFNCYLTNFEQVANLDVISGYHDDVNVAQGLTYFIGSSRSDTQTFYWRSVDHSMAQDGVFPANAWSEWSQVDCAINPYQNVIRPTVRNSRLHLVWLERIEQASEQGGGIVVSYSHVLKLAHVRYDGTWSSPISYPADIYLATLGLADGEVPGLYCAEDLQEESLLVLLYKRSPEPATTPVDGFYILSNLSAGFMGAEQAIFYRDNIYEQFDTTSLRRINNRYAELYEIPSSVELADGFEYGDFQTPYHNGPISKVRGGRIGEIGYTSESGRLSFNASFTLNSTFTSELINYGGTIAYDYYQYESLLTCPPGGWVRFYGVSPLPPEEASPDYYAANLGVVFDCTPNPEVYLVFYHPRSDSTDLGSVTITAGGNVLTQPVLRDYMVGYHIRHPSGSENTESLNNLTKFDLVMPDGYNWASSMQPGYLLKSAITPASIKVIIRAGGEDQVFSGEDFISNPPPQSFTGMVFELQGITFDGSQLSYDENNYGEIEVILEAYFESGEAVGREFFTIPIKRVVQSPSSVLGLGSDGTDVQYMQWGPYRVRMNTLFARQLVERASRGLDAILSLETQNLPEPPMGRGSYVKVTLPPYDSNQHGDERQVKVELLGDSSLPPEQQLFYSYVSATLGDAEQSLNLFIPVSQRVNGDPLDFPTDISAGLGVYLNCQLGRVHSGTLRIDATSLQITAFEHTPEWSAVRDPELQPLANYVEPMDFSGANALYFWELFYYTPMLVAQRLQLEQNFDEAQRWLEYVWCPSGYIVNGVLQNYYWNVRPLLEDTSWNSEPLESTDPDAIAQYDPMHYKVTTFMRTLDLLLARGDQAYRRLERDTLNEAKMWYLQALHLLGEQPYLPEGDDWSAPPLGEAADETLQSQSEQILTALRLGQHPSGMTANTLTGLFLPQANEILLGYWQTLEQRLYNLRHNLSIDGQPLSLPIYAPPADPAALHSAAVSSSQGGSSLPPLSQSLWRFPQIRDSATVMVNQLMQFGSTLMGMMERQDGEALNSLLQNQAGELMLISLSMQDKTIAELEAERKGLEQARNGAQLRRDHYGALYDENIDSGEQAVMDMTMSASIITASATALHMGAAAADMVPNIYGLAVGGAVYGGLLNASAIGTELAAAALQISSTNISQSEAYRRRRQEWEIQRNTAEADVKQLDAQLQALDLRREAAGQQKGYLETQQHHIQAQLEFLKSKFTNQALFSWLSGRLSAVYFQLYDLTVSRCLMAEASYRHDTGEVASSFIKPGAWQGTYAGLSCGEALLLNLAQMDDAYLHWESRALQVSRTVSLSEFYAGLPDGQAFDLATKVAEIVTAGSGSAGTAENGISISEGTLSAYFRLSDLQIKNDYPDSLQLGSSRRIKQISVSLPALVGPYQDVQAVLSYGGSVLLPKGCTALAISHGASDSGLFQLDFNDGMYLPFEGIAIDDSGSLTLRFPNATGKQQALLLTLSDMIAHIRYTIRS